MKMRSTGFFEGCFWATHILKRPKKTLHTYENRVAQQNLRGLAPGAVKPAATHARSARFPVLRLDLASPFFPSKAGLQAGPSVLPSLSNTKILWIDPRAGRFMRLGFRPSLKSSEPIPLDQPSHVASTENIDLGGGSDLRYGF